MTLDPAFAQRNQASTNRIRALAEGLSDDDLLRPVGQHWTVAIALAHLAFWDRRVLAVLDASEREGKVSAPPVDISVNDLLLPFWAAIPPRQAAQIAIESAERLDRRLEEFPPALLEEIYAHTQRWVLRSLHRELHLEEIVAALA